MKRVLACLLSLVLLLGNTSWSALADKSDEADENASEELSFVPAKDGQWIDVGTAVFVDEGQDFELAGTKAGESVTITKKDKTYYGSWETYHFTVTETNGKTHTAYCMEPNKTSPPQGTKCTVKKLASNRDLILMLLLIGPGGPYFNSIGKNVWGSNEYALCHASIGYVYTGSLKGLTESLQNGVKNVVNYTQKTMGTWCTNYHINLADYEVFVASKGGSYQDIVWYENAPKASPTPTPTPTPTNTPTPTPKPGSIRVKKSSSMPEISDGNSCYSLAGAEFTVSMNGSVVGTITTDANGEGSISGLPAGKYHVKETKAPKGYLLNDNAIDVTVSAGSTIYLDFEDTPGNDPVSMVLQKKDAEGNAALGSGSLEGAEYTFKFYDTDDASEDPGKKGKTPKYTTVFKTDEDGWIELNEKCYVRGDNLIKNSTLNRFVFPLGYFPASVSESACSSESV